ncbi:MAG TPA: hypothetical protein VHO72_14465 [Bacteroidales bacterium]|nr:hypothetical protein [Bacteroidales bacterium]
MNKYFVVLVVPLLFGCTDPGKPLTNNEKEEVLHGAKLLVDTIYQACQSCDPGMLTATFLDSPDFFSFIDGKYADYKETVKKYPELMKEFKTQKAFIVQEKYLVIDPSNVLYTSNSNWVCKLQNDSAVFGNCKLEFLLRKEDSHWKVLSWTEAY